MKFNITPPPKNKEGYFSFANRNIKIILDKYKANIERKVKVFSGIPSSEFSRRISQLIMRYYANSFLNLDRNELASLNNSIIKFGRKKVFIKKNGIFDLKISHFILCRNIFTFIAYHFYIFLFISGQLFKKRPRSKYQNTVLFENIVLEHFMQNSEIEFKFLQFCDTGPLPFLKNSDRIILKTGMKRKSPYQRIIWTRKRESFLELLSREGANYSDIFSMYGHWFYILYIYLYNSIKLPIFSFLIRDLALFPVVKYLDRNNSFQHYVVTNSDYYRSPIWIKQFTSKNFLSNFVWYSIGNELYRYKWEDYPFQMPENYYVKSDIMWIWTEYARNFVKQFPETATEYKISGPILWYLPEKSAGTKSTSIRITIFDVVPLTTEYAKQIFGPHRWWYNSGDTIKKYIYDLVEAAENIEIELGIPVQVYLKTKKMNMVEGLHDLSYRDFLSQLVEDQRIKMVELGENLYNVIDKSDVIFGFPYSSPVNIAAYMGKEAYYYDSTGVLINNFMKYKNPGFISDTNELANWRSSFAGRMINEKKRN